MSKFLLGSEILGQDEKPSTILTARFLNEITVKLPEKHITVV